MTANLDAYEVEDYLSEVLNTEFDTIADDGSLPDVSTKDTFHIYAPAIWLILKFISYEL